MGCTSSAAKAGKDAARDSEPAAPVALVPYASPDALTLFGQQYVVPPGEPRVLCLKQKGKKKGADQAKGGAEEETFTVDKVVEDMKTQQPLFVIKAKKDSWHSSQVVFNAEGKPIFKIADNTFSLNDKQTVSSVKDDGHGDQTLFEVSWPSKTQHTEGLKNAKGEDISLTSDVSTKTKSGVVFVGKLGEGTPIAKVSAPEVDEKAQEEADVEEVKNCAKDVAKEALGEALETALGMNPLDQIEEVCEGCEEEKEEKDESLYQIEVAPGVDVALVVAHVLAIARVSQSYALAAGACVAAAVGGAAIVAEGVIS